MLFKTWIQIGGILREWWCDIHPGNRMLIIAAGICAVVWYWALSR